MSEWWPKPKTPQTISETNKTIRSFKLQQKPVKIIFKAVSGTTYPPPLNCSPADLTDPLPARPGSNSDRIWSAICTLTATSYKLTDWANFTAFPLTKNEISATVTDVGKRELFHTNAVATSTDQSDNLLPETMAQDMVVTKGLIVHIFKCLQSMVLSHQWPQNTQKTLKDAWHLRPRNALAKFNSKLMIMTTGIATGGVGKGPGPYSPSLTQNHITGIPWMRPKRSPAEDRPVPASRGTVLQYGRSWFRQHQHLHTPDKYGNWLVNQLVKYLGH